MKRKMEEALRQAVSQLPGPDFDAVAGMPVAPMTVHDSVTLPRPVRRQRWPLVLVLVLLTVAIVGWAWYLYHFQVYSVLDLEAGAEFAIELGRGDRVLAVVPMDRAAEEFLEGRSYRDWTLAATARVLLEELLAKGYVETLSNVTVAVSSRDIDRARDLREEVEALAAGLLPEGIVPPVPLPSPLPSVAPSTAPSQEPSPWMPGHHGYGAQKHMGNNAVN